MLNANFEFILVIPPMRGFKPELFDKEHFYNLYSHVTAFSLMTYDFSNPQRPGPNSPINWVRSCIENLVPNEDKDMRRKILTGLNMYGNDFSGQGGGPIVANQYLGLLKQFKGKFFYDDKSAENFFELK